MTGHLHTRDFEADLLGVVVSVTHVDARSVLVRLLDRAVEHCDAARARLELAARPDTPAEVLVAGPPGCRATAVDPGAEHAVQVAVRVRGVPVGLLEVTRGQPFTADEQERLDALGRAAALVVDVAHRHDLGERRRHWLETSSGLTGALRPPLDLPTALSQVCDAARSVSGARTVTAVTRAPDGTDEVTPAPPSGLDGVDGADGSHGAGGELRIPIATRVAAPATLRVVLPADAGPPGPETTVVLEALADQAAVLLDRLQALRDRSEHEAAQLREQDARGVHDSVLQRLYATGLQLQGIRGVIDEAETRSRIDRTIADVDETMRSIRAAVFPGGPLDPRRQP